MQFAVPSIVERSTSDTVDARQMTRTRLCLVFAPAKLRKIVVQFSRIVKFRLIAPFRLVYFLNKVPDPVANGYWDAIFLGVLPLNGFCFVLLSLNR